MAIKYETSIAILNSSINKNNLKEVQKLLRKASTNVLVNSASSYTLNELIEKCKYVYSNKNIKVIIIDEINTITNFEKEQAEIFSKLKELATTLNICILVIY
jgi:replicative DNA helicase